MIDSRTKMLTATVLKLFRRGAEGNIRRIVERAHTADVASLLENLDTEERLAVFHLIHNNDRKAEIVSYLPESIQNELFSILEAHEAQGIVSRMDQDDAADLLGHLPEEVSKPILSSMVEEDSAMVEELMSYPADSAGGLMSPEIFSLQESMTVGQAVQALQKEDEDVVTFYIYVVNANEQLVGVLSLKHLLLTRPSTLLKDVMSTGVISVNLSTNQADVAHIVEKYDFLSVPVVDDNRKLVGIITVDDVIDVIREEAEEDLLSMGRVGISSREDFVGHLKARFPWTFLSLVGGLACFTILRLLVNPTQVSTASFWLMTAFLPTLLTVASTCAHQSSTYAVGAMKSGQFQLSRQVTMELILGLSFGFIYGLILAGLSLAISGIGPWAIASALSLLILIPFVQMCGAYIPSLLAKIHVDYTSWSIPVLTVVADILAVTLLFGLGQLVVF